MYQEEEKYNSFNNFKLVRDDYNNDYQLENIQNRIVAICSEIEEHLIEIKQHNNDIQEYFSFIKYNKKFILFTSFIFLIGNILLIILNKSH